jgi:DNA processing protein
MNDKLFYKLALSMVPGIGGVLARTLITYAGSAEQVFSEPERALVRIPGIGKVHAGRLKNRQVLHDAEKELEFIRKHHIDVRYFADRNYPRRLKQCPDAPVIIYFKGLANLDEQRIVSIVGTRNATRYGKMLCEELIEGLAQRKHPVLVVSGLAYGIDIHAHRMSLKHHIPTIGVLGHGLDRIYPSLHAQTAKKMVQGGGLLADFPSGTSIEPTNFIRRNRIIAGLADATVVVESAEKGGALITADIAASYNRDVFAFPGRVVDACSTGCNKLIRSNGASLIRGIDDLEYFMGWDPPEKGEKKSPVLFDNLTPVEEKICSLLKKEGELFIDQISSMLQLPGNTVSSRLLEMEFKHLIESLPGKIYRMKH